MKLLIVGILCTISLKIVWAGGGETIFEVLLRSSLEGETGGLLGDIMGYTEEQAFKTG